MFDPRKESISSTYSKQSHLLSKLNSANNSLEIALSKVDTSCMEDVGQVEITGSSSLSFCQARAVSSRGGISISEPNLHKLDNKIPITESQEASIKKAGKVFDLTDKYKEESKEVKRNKIGRRTNKTRPPTIPNSNILTTNTSQT